MRQSTTPAAGCNARRPRPAAARPVPLLNAVCPRAWCGWPLHYSDRDGVHCPACRAVPFALARKGVGR